MSDRLRIMSDEDQIIQSLAEASRWTAALYAIQGGQEVQRRAAAVAFREAVADILRKGDEAVPILARFLVDRRYAAIAQRVLAMIPTVPAFQVLFTRASSQELARSEGALYAIRQLAWSEALAEPLALAYESIGSVRHRDALLMALLRGPSAAGFSLSKAILRTSGDADARERVAREACKRADEQAASLLALAQQDRNARVRVKACYGLALRGERLRAIDLVRLFGRYSAPVREQVLYALARLSLPDGVEVARRGVRDSSPAVRSAAALAVAFLGDQTLLASLTYLLDDRNARVSEQAQSVFYNVTGETLPFPVTGARSVVARLAASLEPGRRYFRAALWTLRAMVGTLLHPGDAHLASANLVSATSQNFGFDSDRDLMNNLAPIEQWERWVEEREHDFVPGHWYYQGCEIE